MYTKTLGHLHIAPPGVFVLILMPEEVCNSVVIESAERWRLLQILLLSTWWSCTVTFHCLPFHCWVAVEFLWFLNFAIIPLTAACGISRGKRYHKLTCFNIGLLSNLMSSLGQPILSQFDEKFDVCDFPHLQQRDWKHLNSKTKSFSPNNVSKATRVDIKMYLYGHSLR